jgi:hypothetical protein
MPLFSSRSKRSRSAAPCRARRSPPPHSGAGARIREIGEEILRHARAPQGGPAEREVLQRQDDGLDDEGRGLQGPALPLRRRLPGAHDPRDGARPPDGLPHPARREAPGGHGRRPEDGRDGQGPDHQDHRRADRGDGPEVHRGHRRGERAPGAQEAVGPGHRVQRRPAGRGVRLRRGGGLVQGQVPRPGHQPARARRGLAPTPVLERDHLGVVPRTNVSIKISSLSAKYDPIDPAGAIEDAMGRLLPILEAAASAAS